MPTHNDNFMLCDFLPNLLSVNNSSRLLSFNQNYRRVNFFWVYLVVILYYWKCIELNLWYWNDGIEVLIFCILSLNVRREFYKVYTSK